MHQPVMLEEVVQGLRVKTDGNYVDGTLGRGGHAEAVLSRLGPAGHLWGIDRDESALTRSQERLAGFGDRFQALRGNYRDMRDLLQARGVTAVDGIVLDLGVSSEQLNEPERGFSFQHDGPLDMRMDRRECLTAATIVNEWSEVELADLFWRYGEERRSRLVARAIVERRRQRAFTTTADLSQLLTDVLGRPHGAAGRRHPATRCFQALRMAVNAEMDGLEEGLEASLGLLSAGGRLAVISFHSLEDRCVKHCFRAHAGRDVALAAGGTIWEGRRPAVKRITRKALRPTVAECATNPRSRSARLRVVERLDDGETGRE